MGIQFFDVAVTRFEQCADESGGHWLSFRSTDAESFVEACAAVKRLSRYERHFDSNERAWWISDAGIRKLLRDEPDFREAVAKYDDTPPRPRSRSSSSSSSSHQQQRAHAQSGQSTRSSKTGVVIIPTKVAESFATLHLLPSASVDLVRAALRVASRSHHPDVGGDPAIMVRLNNAADVATSWIKQQRAS